MSGYAKEIKSVDTELKRLRAHIKKLNEQKKRAEGRLFQYMERYHLDEYDGLQKAKIKPKEPVKRKKPKEKREAVINLLFSSGIADAETVWEEMQKINKSSRREDPNEQLVADII
jgi:hypothetical protein